MRERNSDHDAQEALAAAIFDLDGVVTFTARVHEAAWKELFDDALRTRGARAGETFRPFTSADYRTFVDGRPRYEGVREFLASRGIELPYGEPSDPPGKETVCGLGNRKNEIFAQRLEAMGAEVDDEAIRLVRELKASGVAVGVASSSRNAGRVLERAGLSTLFDTRVDGESSARDGLRGKPEPEIFLECLKRLGGAEAERSVLVEDATVGVAAGRAAGFGLVVGVDRRGDPLALREHGADWIVPSLAGISAEGVLRRFRARRHARPHALAAWGEVEREVAGKELAIFLDYDGTLTEIVDRPELAVLSEAMKETLRALSLAWPTIIVSGRGLDDVAALVGLPDLIYAGSHGFDVAGPDDSGLRLQVDPSLAPVMEEVSRELQERTEVIPGALIENKKFSVAAHYRLVPDERAAEVEEAVDAVLSQHSGLRKAPGKKVFELRAEREWDKGRAVLWLLEELGLDRPDVVPVYVGDDVTDEDAFRALEGRGLGIVVMETPRPTAARYALQDVGEVRTLLGRLSSLRAGPKG